MSKNLVIVESPAKARTISSLLDKKKYKVMASQGHVRDLPRSKIGIDIENNYEPHYITIRGKGPILADLRKEAKKADNVLLATDPDREGEAISWHLANALKIKPEDATRVEFNEVTKTAVENAINNPRKIDQDLVDAQQTRRLLDRLVGYKISPLLWKKIRGGLSAGRVQSVAVKLIRDREQEIEDFIPEEYWSIIIDLIKEDTVFEAEFSGIRNGNKDEKLEINSEKEVKEILKAIGKDNLKVRDIKKGSRKRNPYAPYTTSTLQQDAYNRLRFSSRKTMTIAQQLYEGIGVGNEGLITYMRTDSTRVSSQAVGASKKFITEEFGKEYSNGGRVYGGKSKKGSQDAHEAIRPTNIFNTAENLKSKLNDDQYKLYKLIWERFMASQMSPAVYDTITVNFQKEKYIFRSNGSQLKFPGFLKVYNVKSQKDTFIPDLKEGELVDVKEIKPNQHFTQPPARYTEASLVKTLEELGIGRPSTFAPTISNILNRGYVEFENRSFVPTELGILVNDLLAEYFDEIINEEFTADLENKLDDIAEGSVEWKEVIDEFYKPFSKYLKEAEKEIEEIEVEDEITDEICEKCGKNMVIKHGRFGKFLACPGYPGCKNTKYIVNKIGVDCPKCGGDIIERRSKRGRIFYGCSNFPDCDFSTWNKPIEEKCPDCDELLTRRETKSSIITQCSNKDCKYKKTERKK